jgi:hypothetical protein
MRKHAFALILAAAAAATSVVAQTPPVPAPNPVMEAMQRFSNGEYLAAIDILEAAAFDKSGKVTDAFAYQMWFQLRPVIGGYAAPPEIGTSSPALSAVDADRLRRAQPVEALSAIRTAAAKTRIVILNEAHHSPRDRAFALDVARTLRPLGYTILAAEAFANPDNAGDSAVAQLARDGYPRFETGHYLKDPVFADFVRQSLALGFRPAAYEQKRSQSTPSGGIAEREQAQAENLAALLATNPGAKVLIFVGFSHVLEAPVDRGGKQVEWMAARLKKITGIDPLTIDQANPSEVSLDRWGRDSDALVAPRIGKASILRFAGADLRVGPHGHAVDLQLFHPRTRFTHGRPSWLKTLGRTSRPVPSELLPKTGRRLVQAFLAREGERAIPIDQVLVEAGKPAPKLMLPAGAIRYAVQQPMRETARAAP